MSTNEVIERQKQLLESLENPGEQNQGNPPQSDHIQGVPGQEPPPGDGPGAGPLPTEPKPQNEPAPQSGSADIEALKQQITVLTGQVEEYRSLYNRQHGMVAPLQRKVAEYERTIADLNRKVQEVPAPGTQPAAQQPTQQGKATEPPTQVSEDDPRLKEFQELYGDMIPGLDALIGKAVKAAVQPLQPVVQKMEIDKEADERKEFLKKHLAPLYSRFPKAGDIIRSPQFAEWVEKHPSWQQDAMVDRVLHPENYPVEQVISVFDDYSRNDKQTTTDPSPGEMAVEPKRIPTSSTPGGRTEPQLLTRERLAFINRALTVDKGLYSPEQIQSLQQELEQGEQAANSSGFGLAPRLDTLTR